MITWKRISPERISQMNRCLIEYQKRKEYLSDPKGSRTATGIWLPEQNEWRDCCGRLNGQSRDFPLQLDRHCRSLKHCAALFECDERFVRERWRKIQRGEIVNPLETEESTWKLIQEREADRRRHKAEDRKRREAAAKEKRRRDTRD